jgi:hypothetical protein
MALGSVLLALFAALWHSGLRRAVNAAQAETQAIAPSGEQARSHTDV